MTFGTARPAVRVDTGPAAILAGDHMARFWQGTADAVSPPTRAWPAAARVAMALLALADPASAQVRFGHDVFIAGHDFSHRSYRSVEIRRVRRLHGPIGCRVYPHGFHRRGDGALVRGPVERCNLVAKPHRH